MIILINFIFFYKNSIDIFFKYRKQKLPNNIQIDTDLVFLFNIFGNFNI